MAKITIIGACGYIGNHLCKWMIEKGHTVYKYDIKDLDEENYTKIDLTDPESVKLINLDVDVVVDMAGYTGTYIGFDKYNDFVRFNELSLLNLLDAIRKSEYRPRVVFPSSRLVYKGIDKALTEEDEKDFKTIYAVNKIACEGYLKAYSDSFNIPYTIVRICVPFGNLFSNDYSFGTVGFFIKQASTNKCITLYGDGSIKRTFTSMFDLCLQIEAVCLNQEAVNQTYNIGGVTYSLYEAAKYIADKYKAEIRFVAWPDKDLRIESGHTYFDDSKIKKLISNSFSRYQDLGCLLIGNN